MSLALGVGGRPMETCEHCGGQFETAAAIGARCPSCNRWSERILVGLLRHPEPAVRGNAASSAVLVARTERLIRALAVAVRDPVTSVRQDAGVALFICGREAGGAVPEVIEALRDPDLKVCRLAAAS